MVRLGLSSRSTKRPCWVAFINRCCEMDSVGPSGYDSHLIAFMKVISMFHCSTLVDSNLLICNLLEFLTFKCGLLVANIETSP